MAQILVLAGMSGAGRSTAAAVLEDMGWFVIDNLPVSLMGKVVELVEAPHSEHERIALVIGRGGTDSVGDMTPAVDQLRRGSAPARVLFLDASEDALVRRFEGTRRRHPLNAATVVASISSERELLAPIRDRADLVIDTSELNVHQLRARLIGLFETENPANLLQTSVMSFGFSHGIPLDVDMVLDCRFLPNPHWVEDLRPQTGLDQAVRSYVLAQADTTNFLAKVDDLLGLLLPGYVREGKSYLTLAVGCTGGRHRSVVVAEELATAIRHRGFSPTVTHRYIHR